MKMSWVMAAGAVCTLACSGVQTSDGIKVTVNDDTLLDKPAVENPVESEGDPEASPDLAHLEGTEWRQQDGDLYKLGTGGSIERVPAAGGTHADGGNEGSYTAEGPRLRTVQISWGSSGITETMELSGACSANFSNGEVAIKAVPEGCEGG